MPSKQKRLDILNSEVANCQSCRLCDTRTKTVFGEGNPDAQIMLLGEAPGQTEDETGRPFVGRAGKLLDNMIASMGMAREHVYITNICKCLRYNSMVLLEDGTYERISKLVSTKYNGRVMSVEGSVIVQKVKEGTGDYGFNARTEVYENLYASGVIDPTKVARIALENASSIAGMLLTTECVLADIKEESSAPAMGGGMPGGMGGMY